MADETETETEMPPGTNTHVILDGEGAIDDWLRGRPKPLVRRGTDHVRVVRVVASTRRGHNAVVVFGKLRDGSIGMIALTERSFLTAAQAIGAASLQDGTIAPDILTYGDVRIGESSSKEELERVRAWCEATIDDVNKRLAGPTP